MGTAKKCYNCFTAADDDARICPKCGARLGARLASGVAQKPSSPFPAIFMAAAALALAGMVMRHTAKPAEAATAGVEISNWQADSKDEAILRIKKKGAADLTAVGVADLGHKDDILCVYVDQRFTGLSSEEQTWLLSTVAEEWHKAIGKESTAVNIFESGSKKLLAELIL